MCRWTERGGRAVRRWTRSLPVICAAVLTACSGPPDAAPAAAPATAAVQGALPPGDVERLIGGTPRPLRPERTGYHGLGRAPSAGEIAAWDIDVRPDGAGLPPGSGSVEQGEILYEEKCAVCHGTFGEGADRWPPLAGGAGTLASAEPDKTIGSYWQYPTTVWDYVRRAMPFFEPHSLSADQTYALTAYLFYLNDLVESDFVLSAANLPGIELPNRDGFFLDPRPDSTNTLCMQDCRDRAALRVTWDATDFGVTPSQGAAAAPAGKAAAAAGAEVYASACATCHDNGLAGAPRLADRQQWTRRAAKGIEVLMSNAIDGFQGEAGYMPPRGGQSRLSDGEVQAAVSWMLEQAAGND